ncbi:MAG: hypothetical protein R3217_07570 [Gammaproteobacteria bacterium]|nr:hypothetical protein [Gammaproteobacteria bacterium]
MNKAILSLAALILLPASALADPEPRTFNATVPASNLDSIELDANVGSVFIEGGDGDQVIIEVVLKANDSWHSSDEDAARRIQAAELHKEVHGKTLRLSLDYRNSGNGESLNEEWTIKMPASLRGIYELNVGEMEIIGMAADIEAEVNVGELDIRSLKGDIKAEVNVGEIDIESATASPGDMDLSVNIGDTRLRINGERIEGDRSGWVGADTKHDAGGDDDIEAEVNVGEIRVEVDND